MIKFILIHLIHFVCNDFFFYAYKVFAIILQSKDLHFSWTTVPLLLRILPFDHYSNVKLLNLQKLMLYRYLASYEDLSWLEGIPKIMSSEF